MRRLRVARSPADNLSTVVSCAVARTVPADARELLSGAVERVTFHNPDTGFAVLRVLVPGRRDLVDGRRARRGDCRG